MIYNANKVIDIYEIFNSIFYLFQYQVSLMKISQYSEYKIYKNSPKYLIILLHGYGSNKDDLITIAPELAQFIPNAHFISPNAPYKCEEPGINNAFQWFSLTNRNLKNMIKGIECTTPVLEDFIKVQLDKFNISENNLALLGFSQGTMMSLHIALNGNVTPNCVLGYSGMLLRNHLNISESKSKPKIALIYGRNDTIVPVIEVQKSVNKLKKLGINTVSYEHLNLGHGINEKGIIQGGEFLKRHLKI